MTLGVYFSFLLIAICKVLMVSDHGVMDIRFTATYHVHDLILSAQAERYRTLSKKKFWFSVMFQRKDHSLDANNRNIKLTICSG
jgi:hypothetical protein